MGWLRTRIDRYALISFRFPFRNKTFQRKAIRIKLCLFPYFCQWNSPEQWDRDLYFFCQKIFKQPCYAHVTTSWTFLCGGYRKIPFKLFGAKMQQQILSGRLYNQIHSLEKGVVKICPILHLAHLHWIEKNLYSYAAGSLHETTLFWNADQNMNPCHLKFEILVVVIPYSTQKQLFLLNACGRC